MNWYKLDHIDQLNTIKEASFDQPILLFKHSKTCSISAMALNRMERNYDQKKVGDLKPYCLDLLAHRDVSSEIAKLFNVEHESPQAIVISKGKAIYDASHYDISFADMAEKL